MRLLLFISVLSSLAVRHVAYSHVKDTIYYNQEFQATDSPTNNIMIISNQKKRKLHVVTFEFYKAKWKKTKAKKYKIVSDSIYVNKDIYYNRNTSVENLYSIYKIILVKTSNELFYFKEFNYDNKLLRKGFCKSYFPLNKHGTVTEYYLNGKESNVEEYTNNKFVSSKRWMMSGFESIDNVFREVSQEPLFKNKSVEDFYTDILLSVKYPLKLSREKHIDGACIIEFIVKKNGSIDKLQFIQNSGIDEIDYQVIGFIQKTKKYWSAAEISNEKVDFEMRLFITF